MKKPSLAERVKAFLKGGDDAKLVRFETRLGKYFKSQIDIREKQKEILNDQLADAVEELEDYIPNVNIDKITKADGIDDYIHSYIDGLDGKQANIEEIENAIENIDEEINRLNQLQSLIYKEG